MAFQDLAARSGTVLLDGTESLRLVTALDGPAAVAEALADVRQAVIVYNVAALPAGRDFFFIGNLSGAFDEVRI